MSTELIPIENRSVEFGSLRSPEQTIKEIHQLTAAFAPEARRNGGLIKIGDSEHLKIEAWQLLGWMCRLSASVESTEPIQIGDAHGFKAIATVIKVSDGLIVSRAEAICLNDESKWGLISQYEWKAGKKVKVGDVQKPLHQLLSMAQTRAMSKAFSNVLKHIAKGAGFSVTPAEEMDEVPPPPRASAPPPHDQEAGVDAITEAQATRLYALAKQYNRSQQEMKTILQRFGFDHSSKITYDKYDAICAEVMKGENQ